MNLEKVKECLNQIQAHKSTQYTYEQLKLQKIPYKIIRDSFTVGFLQSLLDEQKLDHLFRNKSIDDKEIVLQDKLTEKIVALCQEHISDLLESLGS